MNPGGEKEADDSRKPPLLVVTESDILFHCPACRGELVVDRAGVGLTCHCPHCGQSLVVPDRSAEPQTAPPPLTPPPPLPSPAGETPGPEKHFDFSNHSAEQIERRLDELKHHLKENQSQDAEMRGHINRATIELHRLQLRLKKLQERRAEIDAESKAAQAQRATRAAS